MGSLNANCSALFPFISFRGKLFATLFLGESWRKLSVVACYWIWTAFWWTPLPRSRASGPAGQPNTIWTPNGLHGRLTAAPALLPFKPFCCTLPLPFIRKKIAGWSAPKLKTSPTSSPFPALRNFSPLSFRINSPSLLLPHERSPKCVSARQACSISFVIWLLPATSSTANPIPSPIKKAQPRYVFLRRIASSLKTPPLASAPAKPPAHECWLCVPPLPTTSSLPPALIGSPTIALRSILFSAPLPPNFSSNSMTRPPTVVSPGCAKEISSQFCSYDLRALVTPKGASFASEGP